MTNGEKFRDIFSISQVDEGELYAYMWLPSHDAVYIPRDWWDAEYNEPVIRDNGVKNELNRVKNELEPTTKNALAAASELEKNSKKLAKDFGESDCISREDALDCVNWGYSFSDIYKKINELPSVTPQERKGHWIKTPKAVMGEGYMWYCDKCEHQVYQDSSRPYPSEKYCPNCGAKMVEPQESEDTE